MSVIVYAKPDCKLCASAKAKLALLGVEFEARDLAEALAISEGWRTDGRVELRAKHALIDERVPMILIDGKPYDYPSAMRVLKKGRHGKAQS